MSKWKCGICNNEFDNYQAQGFNGIIYCPLCYFKELYKREIQEKEDYKSRCEKAIEYIKYNDSDLYTFVPDYDYEENLVDNYESSSFREDLLNILQNGSEDND